ncbi:hypothetical protein NE237_004762 [Protea cynaroides]|uniref:Leucine-rich repeat-containing N-terminal plant-type domain-containing protein n=1 Tax=Protea cynaroides TaxID=273540 RepID=A0A9Q0KJA1_9MAGN|nr:hypothetical protein NE237_004762 [Protea cynaroides]
MKFWFSGQCLEDQKYLLLHLNQNLLIDEPSVDSKLVSWNKSTDCCSWKGVTCDGNSGHVTGLDLSGESMYGGIDNSSSSLFKLRYLQSLNLAENDFQKSFLPIPSGLAKLISRLTRLESLDLSATTDEPNFLRLDKLDFNTLLRNLSGLRILRLDGIDLSREGSQWDRTLSYALPNLWNNFSRKFPEKNLHLKTLQSLDLSWNPLLHGYLPEFHRNGSLQTLNLQGCSFNGSIPSTIVEHNQLGYLDLSSNSFTGPIPLLPETLIEVILAENNLTNTIHSMERYHRLYSPCMHTLKYLLLQQNQFAGQLTELHNTSSAPLDTLDLGSNKLEGPIPLSIFELQHLTGLKLSFNNFSGLSYLDLSYNSLWINSSICKSVSSFRWLEKLNLASCNLPCFPDFLTRNQVGMDFLDLSNNQIHGQLPSWVWQIGGERYVAWLNFSFNFLNNLDQPFPDPKNYTIFLLDLTSNLLQGPIPVLSPLLKYLDLSNNNFQSNILSNFTRGNYVTHFFSLSSNNLTGEIPQSICNFGQLEILDLSNNSLRGTIPLCLANMSNLRVLYLQHNYLVGRIPRIFPVVCSLWALDLSRNRLEGPLPKSLANCKKLENCTFPKLQIVDLSSNDLMGNLPSECLMKLTTMMAVNDETLSFDFLNYTDEVVIKNYGSSFLKIIIQQKTMGKVTIKGQEMELTKIPIVYTTIDLSNNGFEGEIPDVIGDLIALHFLNLSQNTLTGQIPSSLGNLKQLESLDLSRNKLEGEIPQQLTSLTFLSFLNLSWNDLTGTIPTTNQFGTFTETSFGGNEGLCGALLSRNCMSIEPAALPPTTSMSNKRQLFGYDWDMVVSGFVVGFGGGAGGVVAFIFFSDPGRKWLLSRS